LKFHGDPGDRLLAAAALSHELALCTHDKQLLRFGRQGLYKALKVNEKSDPDAH
jgi:PIN domain nuclease of toxin-antitoxin system